MIMNSQPYVPLLYLYMITFLIYSLGSNYYDRNNIGTEGAVALSVAMETMSNLQYLE